MADMDEAKGKAKEGMGTVQEKAGQMTGNRRMEGEGAEKRGEGKAQEAWGKTKDAAGDAVDAAKDAFKR